MLDSQLLRAMLEWQLELGCDEAIAEAPRDRYAEAEAERAARAAYQATHPAPSPATGPATGSAPGSAPRSRPAPGQGRSTAPPPDPVAPDPVAAARAQAAAAPDLAQLAAAQSQFAHCDLRRGARNFVFSDGQPGARVMVIGEAPGRDEDAEGRPFVGRAGQLLDKMFDAIGLARGASEAAAAIYITNVLPWRPPANRTPTAEEIAMMLPFLARHVALANPDLLVLMGNTPCQAALGRAGILSLRGRWAEAFGRPALPMAHPAYLLRNPIAKREAWADLLALRARLRSLPS